MRWIVLVGANRFERIRRLRILSKDAENYCYFHDKILRRMKENNPFSYEKWLFRAIENESRYGKLTVFIEELGDNFLPDELIDFVQHLKNEHPEMRVIISTDSRFLMAQMRKEELLIVTDSGVKPFKIEPRLSLASDFDMEMYQKTVANSLARDFQRFKYLEHSADDIEGFKEFSTLQEKLFREGLLTKR